MLSRQCFILKPIKNIIVNLYQHLITSIRSFQPSWLTVASKLGGQCQRKIKIIFLSYDSHLRSRCEKCKRSVNSWFPDHSNTS